jgi:hypothetical protein
MSACVTGMLSGGGEGVCLVARCVGAYDALCCCQLAMERLKTCKAAQRPGLASAGHATRATCHISFLQRVAQQQVAHHQLDRGAAGQAGQQRGQQCRADCHRRQLCMVADVLHRVWAQRVVQRHAHHGVGVAGAVHQHPLCAVVGEVR